MSIGKLYYTPTSCGAASFIAASISGAQFDSEQVDLRSHKTASGKDFYEVNPKGNVPAIVTLKGLLCEGPSIMSYIADQAPQSKLAPANGTFERYKLQDTFNFVGTELHQSYGPLFSPGWDDVSKQKFKDKIITKLTFLEKNFLGQDPALNPQQPSIAGIYLFIVLSWNSFLGVDTSSFPKIKKFQEEFGANKQVKEAQEKMNVGSK